MKGQSMSFKSSEREVKIDRFVKEKEENFANYRWKMEIQLKICCSFVVRNVVRSFESSMTSDKSLRIIVSELKS